MVTDMVVLFEAIQPRIQPPPPSEASLSLHVPVGVCVSAQSDFFSPHNLRQKITQNFRKSLWFSQYISYIFHILRSTRAPAMLQTAEVRTDDICQRNTVLSRDHWAQEGKEQVTVALPKRLKAEEPRTPGILERVPMSGARRRKQSRCYHWRYRDKVGPWHRNMKRKGRTGCLLFSLLLCKELSALWAEAHRWRKDIWRVTGGGTHGWKGKKKKPFGWSSCAHILSDQEHTADGLNGNRMVMSCKDVKSAMSKFQEREKCRVE